MHFTNRNGYDLTSQDYTISKEKLALTTTCPK